MEIDKCISCGMCERSCPSGSLKVSKKDYTWQIDRFDCVQCGYCVTKCPVKCLSMVPGYQPPEPHKAWDIFRKSPEAIAAEEEKKKMKAEAARKALAAKKAKEAAAAENVKNTPEV
ncbi:MAG: NADH-quinone oxidoreductase subunit I [Bilifractor sp.]